MRSPQLASRAVGILAVPLILAGVAAVGPTPTAAARAPSPGPAACCRFAPEYQGVPFTGALQGVAATSASNVWAGGYTQGESLIEHWDGTAWKWDSTLTVGPPNSSFYSVAATSASNAWAVGYSSTEPETLILHWNGTTWKQVPGPGFDILYGVAATSASNAWAVGEGTAHYGGAQKPLILRWNGTTWKQVPIPTGILRLYSVAATSASHAWAVGAAVGVNDVGMNTTLILQWNGTTWTRFPSPSTGSGTSDTLSGVTATSATNAWAVGTVNNTFNNTTTLVLHWNGTTWAQVPSPNPVGSGHYQASALYGVTATSATNAWAVGAFNNVNNFPTTLVLHWNGTTWKQVPSPSPGNGNGATLAGVAATSANNAWAVGTWGQGTDVVVLHWNGSAWKTSPTAPMP